MTTKEVITNDVFDIAKRLKEIDSFYFVVFDKKLCRFEVHNSRQGKNTLAVVLPYNRLDCRAIDHVLKTRTQYIAKRLDEIEMHNKKLQDEAKQLAIAKAIEKCQDMLSRP